MFMSDDDATAPTMSKKRRVAASHRVSNDDYMHYFDYSGSSADESSDTGGQSLCVNIAIFAHMRYHIVSNTFAQSHKRIPQPLATVGACIYS